MFDKGIYYKSDIKEKVKCDLVEVFKSYENIYKGKTFKVKLMQSVGQNSEEIKEIKTIIFETTVESNDIQKVFNEDTFRELLERYKDHEYKEYGFVFNICAKDSVEDILSNIDIIQITKNTRNNYYFFVYMICKNNTKELFKLKMLSVKEFTRWGDISDYLYKV